VLALQAAQRASNADSPGIGQKTVQVHLALYQLSPAISRRLEVHHRQCQGSDSSNQTQPILFLVPLVLLVLFALPNLFNPLVAVVRLLVKVAVVSNVVRVVIGHEIVQTAQAPAQVHSAHQGQENASSVDSLGIGHAIVQTRMHVDLFQVARHPDLDYLAHTVAARWDLVYSEDSSRFSVDYFLGFSGLLTLSPRGGSGEQLPCVGCVKDSYRSKTSVHEIPRKVISTLNARCD